MLRLPRRLDRRLGPIQANSGEHQALLRADADRLHDLTFDENREVLDALQAQFTLEEDVRLRILPVLPTAADISL